MVQANKKRKHDQKLGVGIMFEPLKHLFLTLFQQSKKEKQVRNIEIWVDRRWLADVVGTYSTIFAIPSGVIKHGAIGISPLKRCVYFPETAGKKLVTDGRYIEWCREGLSCKKSNFCWVISSIHPHLFWGMLRTFQQYSWLQMNLSCMLNFDLTVPIIAHYLSCHCSILVVIL